MDIVAVYNPTYQAIRSAVSRATKGDFDELNQTVTVCTVHCYNYFIFLTEP